MINKKILISLGGTFEPIDAVRGITNNSSGKMGLELAKQAYIQGADVTLIVGNVSVEIPPIFSTVNVTTTDEMAENVFKLIPNFDIFISTAAVSDFKVAGSKNYKISSDSHLDLTLEPTVKILSKVKQINPSIFLVGFKAKYNVSKEELIESARKQISDSKTDLVIANDVGAIDCNFGSDKNKVLIIDDDVIETPLRNKKEIAKIVLDEVSKRL